MITLNNFLNNLELNYFNLSVAMIAIYTIIMIVFYGKRMLEIIFDTAGMAFVFYVANIMYKGDNPTLKYFSNIVEKYHANGMEVFHSTFIFLGIVAVLTLFVRFNEIKEGMIATEFLGAFRLALFFAIINVSFFGAAINYIFFIPLYLFVAYQLMEFEAVSKVAHSKRL